MTKNEYMMYFKSATGCTLTPIDSEFTFTICQGVTARVSFTYVKEVVRSYINERISSFEDLEQEAILCGNYADANYYHTLAREWSNA